MSKRNPWVRVLHMRDYANLALQTARGRSRQEVEDDYTRRYTLVHLLELVGEAAAHVEPSIRELAQDIPWSRLVDTRNRLIHGYDYLDYEILWDVVHQDLPVSVAQLERLLAHR